MRSLSLESIPANKNMKLLSLLVTLFALSYANSGTTTKTFCELLNSLEILEKHEFKALNISEKIIQTPREIKNACECETLFAKHLRKFLMTFKSVLPKIQYANILDNLRHFHHLAVKNETNDSCNFTTYNRTTFASDDIKALIQDNIVFIQNWNAHCKPKDQSRKSRK